MSSQASPSELSASTAAPSSSGHSRVPSAAYNQAESTDSVSTTSTVSPPTLPELPPLLPLPPLRAIWDRVGPQQEQTGSAETTSTQGSRPANKRTTSRRKSPTSKRVIQKPASSQTAQAVSTSNAKASRRFWNWRMKVAYDQCSLPTETASVGLPTICSSTFSSSTTRKSSWAHTIRSPPPAQRSSSQTTFSRSLRSLVPGSTAAEAPVGASASATQPPPSKPRKRSKKSPKEVVGEDSLGLPPLSTQAVAAMEGVTQAETTEATPEQTPEEEEAPNKRKVPINKRKRPIEGQLRTFRVRMVPTAAQRVVLQEAFAGARWVYNSVVKSINNCAIKDEVSGEERRVPPNMQLLRDAVRHEPNKPQCVVKLHDKIIAGAVQQACDAFKTNFAKMEKQGKKYHFRVGFRSYKLSYTETLRIERGKHGPLNRFEPMSKPAGDKRRHSARAECLAFLGGGLKAMGGVRLQDKEEVIGRMLSEGGILQENAKIQWDKRTNSFYFIYTYDMPVPVDPDPEFEAKTVLSGDLGVAPFLEWYQPDGSHGSVLNNFSSEIENRCLKLDALQSRIAKRQTARCPENYRRKGRRRRRTTRRLRHKLARDRRRLHNWVEAAHYEAANFLLARADVLVVPKIASKRLSKRAERNIRSGTVRTMLTSSPGLFCDRLKSCATKYPGRHVFTDTGEPGTSKTVGCCGWFNVSLRVGMEQCHCPRCNVTIDRQVNGARNNLLAALGKATGIGWDGQSM